MGVGMIFLLLLGSWCTNYIAIMYAEQWVSIKIMGEKMGPALLHDGPETCSPKRVALMKNQANPL
jgi:hypothetical protein